jgi:hypothetical protein
VRAVLAAVADAVDRGTFDAHGDLKLEHVFIADRVRLCDPAPRFDDPSLHAFTPAYNPRGLKGAAADVAACASMLRYLSGGPGSAWRWAEEVLDAPTPPAWASDHRAALARLDELMATDDPAPPQAQASPDPFADGPPISLPMSWRTGPTDDKLTIFASVDRIMVAAVDIILGSNLADHPDVTPPQPELVEVDVSAVVEALATVLRTSVSEPSTERDVTWTTVGRLCEWGRHALTILMTERPGLDELRLKLPPGPRADIVQVVLHHTFDAYVENHRAQQTSGSSDEYDTWGTHTWMELLDADQATPLDVVWAAALLTAEVADLRRADPEPAGGLAATFDRIGSYLMSGLLAWDYRYGFLVMRPQRYGLRTFFDGGSGALIWQSTQSTIDRWDFYVDHFDLPIPVSLASQVQYLVRRYDLAFDGIGPELVPFGEGEAEQFRRDYHAVCDELARALGSAYSIDERSDPSPTPG